MSVDTTGTLARSCNVNAMKAVQDWCRRMLFDQIAQPMEKPSSEESHLGSSASAQVVQIAQATPPASLHTGSSHCVAIAQDSIDIWLTAIRVCTFGTSFTWRHRASSACVPAQRFCRVLPHLFALPTALSQRPLTTVRKLRVEQWNVALQRRHHACMSHSLLQAWVNSVFGHTAANGTAKAQLPHVESTNCFDLRRMLDWFRARSHIV